MACWTRPHSRRRPVQSTPAIARPRAAGAKRTRPIEHQASDPNPKPCTASPLSGMRIVCQVHAPGQGGSSYIFPSPSDVGLSKRLIARHARSVRIVCDHIFRSEEHTSELQSLMRTSYAVFCLNKKKNKL